MPKLKTHRGAAKRFKISGNGKIRRWKAYHSHLLTKKNRKRKRQLRQSEQLNASNLPAIRRLLNR